MGSLYKRGRVWWIKYHHRSKTIRESSESHKKSAARELLKKREGEIAEGKRPGVRFDKTTFGDLTDLLLQDYRQNERKSLNRAEQSVEHLKGHFEGFRANAIDMAAVNKYIELRQGEEAANATINRELSALKRAFSLAKIAGMVDNVPHISKLREDNTRTGYSLSTASFWPSGRPCRSICGVL